MHTQCCYQLLDSVRVASVGVFQLELVLNVPLVALALQELDRGVARLLAEQGKVVSVTLEGGCNRLLGHLMHGRGVEVAGADRADDPFDLGFRHLMHLALERLAVPPAMNRIVLSSQDMRRSASRPPLGLGGSARLDRNPVGRAFRPRRGAQVVVVIEHPSSAV